MPRRLIAALLLVAYTAVLVKVIVFKGNLSVPAWVQAPREDVRVHLGPGEQARGGRQGRGRGDRRDILSSADRDGRPMGPDGHATPAGSQSLSRFSPLHANFVPFKTILPQLRGEPRWSTAILNLVGNTVLFAPLGFLVGLVHRKFTWPQALAVAVAVGLAMEGMEGWFRVGIVDVDDVLLNAAGVASGYAVFRYWLRQPRSKAGAPVIETTP
jgi:glycopeptide antibiotics resistance protein